MIILTYIFCNKSIKNKKEKIFDISLRCLFIFKLLIIQQTL